MKYLDEIIYTTLAFVVTGFLKLLHWFIKRILTDSKRIELLEASLKARDELRVTEREEDVQWREEVRSEIKGLHTNLKYEVDILKRDILDVYKRSQ